MEMNEIPMIFMVYGCGVGRAGVSRTVGNA
jgi:hypothetical protein